MCSHNINMENSLARGVVIPTVSVYGTKATHEHSGLKGLCLLPILSAVSVYRPSLPPSLPQDEHHTLVQLGTSCRGISIYREQTEVMQFPWPNVVKISYRRRKFRIRHRPTDDPNDRKSIATIKFICGEPPAAKRVWKNAVEQHTFFRSAQKRAGYRKYRECNNNVEEREEIPIT